MDLNELRKKFEADEAPVPFGAWERLESALDKREPRSPIVWWLSVVLLFLGLGIGTHIYQNIADDQVASSSPSIKQMPSVSGKPSTFAKGELAIATPSLSNPNQTQNSSPENTRPEPNNSEGTKESISPKVPINAPTSTKTKASSTSSGPQANNQTTPSKPNQVPDYVRSNPKNNQANQTHRNRKPTITLIGARARNSVLSVPNENLTAVENPNSTHTQLAVNTRSSKTTTITNGGNNPQTANVAPTESGQNNSNNNPNTRIGGNAITPQSGNTQYQNANGQGSGASGRSTSQLASGKDAFYGTSALDSVESTTSKSAPNSENTAITALPKVKADSILEANTLLKPDSALTAVNKPTESPRQTIARFSLWAELNMGNSPLTKISPNTNDGVLMNGATINNQWQPSITQASIALKYMVKPSVQLIGGIIWQYEQLSYSRNIATHNQLQGRSVSADGNMVTNYVPVFQGHNGNITRHFVGLQTGANLQLLPRLHLSGLIQLPLGTTGTEGNTTAIQNWQAGMHYGLTPTIQLGAFWQQSLGTTLKMVDGTSITRSYAGISIRYRLK